MTYPCAGCLVTIPLAQERRAAARYAGNAQKQNGYAGALLSRVGLDGVERLGVRAEKQPSRWLTLSAWRIIERMETDSA